MPYAFYTMAYGNEILQVFLPSIDKDDCISAQKPILRAFPNPGSPEPQRFGEPKIKVEHLTGRGPVKGEMISVIFGFEDINKDKRDPVR